jgi:DNA repair protein RadC
MAQVLSSIRNWPDSEKPRERLLRMGPEYLSDSELLAVIIGSGSFSSGMNAVETARALLNKCETLEKISRAAPEELMNIKGIGPTKASKLLAAFEIARRLASRNSCPGFRILSSKDVFEFLCGKLSGQKKEFFYTLLLNGKNRILKCENISIGSLTSSIVHPRESFLPAIKFSAAAVIFVHNHPSGDPTPSQEDKLITRRLFEAGEILGIKVLDHVIIGDNNYYSFADNNDLIYSINKA